VSTKEGLRRRRGRRLRGDVRPEGGLAAALTGIKKSEGARARIGTDMCNGRPKRMDTHSGGELRSLREEGRYGEIKQAQNRSEPHASF